tara:strand:+ start:1338 stop:3170 length:1833 start_codon:yes stop_codon:yes gene_type:complete
MAAIVEIDYFNSYWLKRIQTGPQVIDGCNNSIENPMFNDQAYVSNVDPNITWPGPAWYGDANKSTNPNGLLVRNGNIFIEESRIRAGFNNVQTDLGVKAYINEKEPQQKHRINALIYSGLFNSSTGINRTNVFSVADSITKAADINNGSIQRIYTEDTNLIIFQENKVSRALIDKDAIFSAEGGGSITTSNLVIGQIIPYTGDYGISRNPESFAVFGFRKYFVDKYRSSVMRLSRDGLTEISNYGMIDYFRDNLSSIQDEYTKQGFVFSTQSDLTNSSTIVLDNYNRNIPLFIGSVFEIQDSTGSWPVSSNYITKLVSLTSTSVEIHLNDPITISVGDNVRFNSFTKGFIIGGFDIHTKQYHLSLQQNPHIYDQSLSTYDTLAFDESVLGWTSFLTYKPNFMSSLKNSFYSIISSGLYIHNYQGSANNRNTFYDVSTQPQVTFVFNPQPDLSKNFQTISYEGSNGWKMSILKSDDLEPIISPYTADSNGNFVPNFGVANWIKYADSSNIIRSLYEGRYEDYSPYNSGALALTPPFKYSGFVQKENLYVAYINNNNTTTAGEVLFMENGGPVSSGIKANYVTATMTTDEITDKDGAKELFAVSTTFVKSGF